MTSKEIIEISQYNDLLRETYDYYNFRIKPSLTTSYKLIRTKIDKDLQDFTSFLKNFKLSDDTMHNVIQISELINYIEILQNDINIPEINPNKLFAESVSMTFKIETLQIYEMLNSRFHAILSEVKSIITQYINDIIIKINLNKDYILSLQTKYKVYNSLLYYYTLVLKEYYKIDPKFVNDIVREDITYLFKSDIKATIGQPIIDRLGFKPDQHLNTSSIISNNVNIIIVITAIITPFYKYDVESIIDKNIKMYQGANTELIQTFNKIVQKEPINDAKEETKNKEFYIKIISNGQEYSHEAFAQLSLSTGLLEQKELLCSCVEYVDSNKWRYLQYSNAKIFVIDNKIKQFLLNNIDITTKYNSELEKKIVKNMFFDKSFDEEAIDTISINKEQIKAQLFDDIKTYIMERIKKASLYSIISHKDIKNVYINSLIKSYNNINIDSENNEEIMISYLRALNDSGNKFLQDLLEGNKFNKDNIDDTIRYSLKNTLNDNDKAYLAFLAKYNMMK